MAGGGRGGGSLFRKIFALSQAPQQSYPSGMIDKTFSDSKIPVWKGPPLCLMGWMPLRGPNRLLGAIKPEPSAGPFCGISITPRNPFHLLWTPRYAAFHQRAHEHDSVFPSA